MRNFNRTLLLQWLQGYQGGTVHQAAAAFGLSVDSIIHTSEDEFRQLLAKKVVMFEEAKDVESEIPGEVPVGQFTISGRPIVHLSARTDSKSADKVLGYTSVLTEFARKYLGLTDPDIAEQAQPLDKNGLAAALMTRVPETISKDGRDIWIDDGRPIKSLKKADVVPTADQIGERIHQIQREKRAVPDQSHPL